MLSSCNLVNAYQALTGSTPSSRSNHRHVFHILVHPQILNHVNRIGVLNDTAGFSTSDHLPFFIDLDRSMFTNKLSDTLSPMYRTLKSTNVTSVSKYVSEALRNIHHHNIPHRLRNLQSKIAQQGFNPSVSAELENIDRMVTAIRLQCERNLVPPPTPFKSTTITKRQVTIIRLLQTLQRRFEKRQDPSSIITQLKK